MSCVSVRLYNVCLHALQRVTLVPDPCTLLIDGVTIGLTSTDILIHMGAEEISWWVRLFSNLHQILTSRWQIRNTKVSYWPTFLCRFIKNRADRFLKLFTWSYFPMKVIGVHSWNWCFALQWNRLRQILTYTEAHAHTAEVNPEGVQIYLFIWDHVLLVIVSMFSCPVTTHCIRLRTR